jgi:hypothetical protein
VPIRESLAETPEFPIGGEPRVKFGSIFRPHLGSPILEVDDGVVTDVAMSNRRIVRSTKNGKPDESGSALWSARASLEPAPAPRKAFREESVFS